MSAAIELLEATGTAVRNAAALPAVKHYHRKRDRKRLRDNAAEAIAQSADLLEQQAGEVRTRGDKALALSMMKQAEKLHAQARRIEQQASRRRRTQREKAHRQHEQHASPRSPQRPNPNWWDN